MGPGNVAPEFEALNRTHGAGQFVAFGANFAGERGRRVSDWHIDVTPGDVVGSESPLRLIVPKKLLDAGLVDGRAGQGQRYGGVDGEDASGRRIVRGRVHAVERHVG